MSKDLPLQIHHPSPPQKIQISRGGGLKQVGYGQSKRNQKEFLLGAQSKMRNPPSQLDLKVLENITGREREPEPPKASRPSGESPVSPHHTEAVLVLGHRGRKERLIQSIILTPEVTLDHLQPAHLLGQKTPFSPVSPGAAVPVRKGHSSWASPKFA